VPRRTWNNTDPARCSTRCTTPEATESGATMRIMLPALTSITLLGSSNVAESLAPVSTSIGNE
jgi:hypothetical protein